MAKQMKFTDKAIAGLPSPAEGQRAEYADTEIGGLRLRVSASGVRTFSLLRRVKNGPMERITLGRYPDIKTERARSDAQKIIGKIAEGANPGEVKRAHKAEPTFAVLFADYIERHAKLKKKTWKEDQQKYRDYLEMSLGKKRLSSITRQDLGAIHAEITKTGHTTLANRVKDLFSSVFSRGIKWGYLNTNPAKGIEDNKEKSRERFLLPGELPRIFASLEAETNKHFRDYFLLALLTGARRSNVAAMRWPDLNMEQCLWTIPDLVTKNGDPHIAPLVPEAIQILEQRKASRSETSPFVFPAHRNNSKLGYMTGQRKAWLRIIDRDELGEITNRLNAAGHAFQVKSNETVQKALARAKACAAKAKVNIEGTRILNLTIHDLRRTLGSWQARTGASMIVIGKSLGHKSQQATAVYARLDIDPVRQAMETATSAMMEAGGMKKSADVKPIRKARA